MMKVMKEFDLHGLKHEEVSDKVEDFILKNFKAKMC